MCSRYEQYFFSLTFLVVELEASRGIEALKDVFYRNLSNQRSMQLLEEVPLPQGHSRSDLSFFCVGKMHSFNLRACENGGKRSE